MVLFTVVKTASWIFWVLRSFPYNCYSRICLGRSLLKGALSFSSSSGYQELTSLAFQQDILWQSQWKKVGVWGQDTEKGEHRGKSQGREGSKRSLLIELENLKGEERTCTLKCTHPPNHPCQWIEPFVYLASKIFKADDLQIWLSKSEYHWKCSLL